MDVFFVCLMASTLLQYDTYVSSYNILMASTLRQYDTYVLSYNILRLRRGAAEAGSGHGRLARRARPAAVAGQSGERRRQQAIRHSLSRQQQQLGPQLPFPASRQSRLPRRAGVPVPHVLLQSRQAR